MGTDALSLRQHFEHAGQGHVFAHWGKLSESEHQNLLNDAAAIDLAELKELCATHLGNAPAANDFSGLEPAPYIAHPDNGGDLNAWEKARLNGIEALKADRIAAFTVAGGQGTRLGYDGPKGTLPVTPVRQQTLFEVFAHKIRFANDTYGCDLPWFIMTSQLNHEATVAFFKDNDYFGLHPERVQCFRQGLMPAVDLQGKILLEAPHRIAMSPDGHGGSLRALVRSGAVEQMRREGRDIISYFQVDNPLVKAIDPTFIGFHLAQRSQMSSKMIPKAYAREKMGVFCKHDSKLCVIEYSDLPEALAEETDTQGRLRYLSGSIAVHLLDRDFVALAGGTDAAVQLPFHRAHKKIPTIDANGQPHNPESPNGYKFEMFVFDAIPFAKNPLVLETSRREEFSAVKNATGPDSPRTCRDDQLRLFARWLNAASASLAVDGTGLPAIKIEISPRFADDERTFVERWTALDPKPALTDNLVIDS